jgi:hypothetical protein
MGATPFRETRLTPLDDFSAPDAKAHRAWG